MEEKQIKKEAIITGIQLAGGFVGGIGNSQLKTLNSQSVVPTRELPTYGFLGSLAGLVGTALIIWRLKKDFSLNQNFVIAIACGLSFQLILSGIIDLVSLKSQVMELRNANIIEQQQSIETIQDLAAKTADPKIKKEAVEEITKIAQRSESEEVVEEAIAALDDTDDNSRNIEVQLTTIANLEQLAINSQSDEVRLTITDSLNHYLQGYGKRVADRATEALNNIKIAREEEEDAEE